MILDTLRSAGYYFDVHGGLEAGFAFIQDAVRGALPDGEYDIDGGKVYAVVSSCSGVGRGKARLESHKKFIDIQYCLEGRDVIGWKHIDECLHPEQPYDEARDIQFFSDRADTWVELAGETFCVLFPHDTHAPLAASGKCRKVVVKIAV